MKKGNTTFRSILVAATLVVSLAFTGCTADSNDVMDANIQDTAVLASNEVPFSVTLEAFSEGDNITTKGDVTNATLFVFNDKGDYIKQITVNESTLLNRKAIEFSCGNSKSATVIAWAGLTGKEDVSSLSAANMISDLQVQLKQNNGVASLPGDLFYGQITISQPTSKAASAQKLNIERKVSSISLKAKGLERKEGNYFFKVKKTKSSFNYNGELDGSENAEYVFEAFFDKNNELVTKTSNILPSSDISVELYNGDEMLFSSKKARNNEIVSVNAGKQANLVFDLSNGDFSYVVSPWNSSVVYVTAE